MHDSDSGMIPLLAGIGIKIRNVKLEWNQELVTGIGMRI